MEPTSTGVQKWLSSFQAIDNELRVGGATLDCEALPRRYRSQHTTNRQFIFFGLTSRRLSLRFMPKLPKAVAERVGDNDPVGRVAGQLIDAP